MTFASCNNCSVFLVNAECKYSGCLHNRGNNKFAIAKNFSYDGKNGLAGIPTKYKPKTKFEMFGKVTLYDINIFDTK